MSPSHAFVRSRELQQKPWDWKSLPVSEGGFIRVVSPHHLILNPAVSFGTVAWRGTKDLTESTTAYWEVQVDGSPYGTSVQFGIGRRHTVSQTYDFVDLLGRDDNSYGLNYRGYAQRSGMNVRVCKPLEGINPRIGLFFDGPNRSLSFFINNEFLGTPFVDIDLSETLYPFVSSTAQCTSMRICNQYSKNQVLSLLSLTRRKVNDSFHTHLISDILPKNILSSSQVY